MVIKKNNINKLAFKLSMQSPFSSIEISNSSLSYISLNYYDKNKVYPLLKKIHLTNRQIHNFTQNDY
ncbi:Hypothetical protein ERGA_CDS_08750 [Ehrlichia ruminantium str. Gardel]|nr:Hypothetical protein ERGA_CDS_08750 [Ehrlichia ruminantium str. Gardel]